MPATLSRGSDFSSSKISDSDHFCFDSIRGRRNACPERAQAQSSAWCSLPVREIERALLFLHRAPSAAPSPFELYFASDGLQFAGDVTNGFGCLRRFRSNAVQCCSIDARPAGKRSHWSELPAAIVSAPPASAAKRLAGVGDGDAVRTRRRRWRLLRTQLVERRKTMKATEERRRVIDSDSDIWELRYNIFVGLARLLVAQRALLLLRNSISSPNSSGLRAFFVKSAATAAESLVSFGISLLTLRKSQTLAVARQFPNDIGILAIV